MEQLSKSAAQAVKDVHALNPLSGSWTNFVTINLVANAQLAAGGRAAMCFLPDEAEPLAFASKSIYINVGTLQPVAAQALPAAARAAVKFQKPWVLDPVAAGLGATRTQTLKELKQFKPDIIRGNASEIIALAGIWDLKAQNNAGKVEGVDATDAVETALPFAKILSDYTGKTVAVSGESDIIVNSNRAVKISGGSALLKKITGAGCSLGGVMAVYAAAADSFTAALTASAIYKLASENAAKSNKGTFSFQTAFIDNLSLLDAQSVQKYILEKAAII